MKGEEFARTKGGRDNTYNASVEINCLDWEQAEKEREFVEYYQGLIALRKQLPGLCDKSIEARKRIYNMWKRPGCIGFMADNRSSGKETVRQYVETCVTKKYWDRLYIVYNANQWDEEVRLPEGTWEILADGEDSFRWEMPTEVEQAAKISPVSILVLGQRVQKGKKL